MTKMSDILRYELERGLILMLLIDAQMRPVPNFILLGMMEGQGRPLDDMKALDFHLTYLSDYGLVERKHPREGRINLDVQTVRAVGKAVDLRDGRITPVPGVRFPIVEL
jgi:hypothetical protein